MQDSAVHAQCLIVVSWIERLVGLSDLLFCDLHRTGNLSSENCCGCRYGMGG